MRRLALDAKKRRIAGSTFVLVLGIGCSSAVDNNPRTKAGDGMDPAAARLGQSKVQFRNPEMAAIYQAAKASPREFEPVYTYARAVAAVALSSLVDKRCETCMEGTTRYRPRSELEPRYWPIIEDALAMLETLAGVPGLTLEQVDQLTAYRGRLLWLVGRSMEEQNMIDDYAQKHPNAVAVVRRRLELLRENGEASAVESQCARSRAKTESSSDDARADLLTACVAYHLDNKEGRSDLVDYAKYLPNLTAAEENIYRGNLVQRCVDKVGDEGTRCAEACACEDPESGKPPAAKCKKACGGCKSETAQKLNLCKKIAEAPSIVARAPEPKSDAPVSRSRKKRAAPAPRIKFDPPKLTPKQKKDDKLLQQMEL